MTERRRSEVPQTALGFKPPPRRRTFDEKREMVWDDYAAGLISEERASEMLRVIGQHEEANHARR